MIDAISILTIYLKFEFENCKNIASKLNEIERQNDEH